MFVIAGCMNPESRKMAIQSEAKDCLFEGAQLTTALSCLKKKGLQKWNLQRNVASFQSCGPYWGSPFVQSCAGIIIERDQDKIISIRYWGALDGV